MPAAPRNSHLVDSLSDLLPMARPLTPRSSTPFDYYTGIIFKGYAEGIAASLASGGRYDAVLANLGREGTAACGFALSLERLQEILGEPGESGVVTPWREAAERPLRIVFPGSLLKDTIRVLEAAGLPVEGLRDPGRQLTVREGDVEYVIVRAQDAPAFVGHGGCDCGILWARLAR